uniref:Photosystem II reaction center protein Ycf12 n=1 Tax=Dulem virus 162 TaxID=3145639 RepID=A0AAU8AWD3_9VIRU
MSMDVLTLIGQAILLGPYPLVLLAMILHSRK